MRKRACAVGLENPPASVCIAGVTACTNWSGFRMHDALIQYNPKYIPWMNIILGQSFSTRSVIPQLVIVTPTRFLDFNTRTYNNKCLKFTSEYIFPWALFS